ncbi:hypothetical protein FCOIX_11466 [Fusarium coicis]|nr:hypothetical protein FCOIX_11466 [Fusarium coicis]
MKLRSFLLQLLPLFLLADAALAQNTLEQTCTGLKNFSKCKFEFSVPYGVNVTLKTVPDKKIRQMQVQGEIQETLPNCEEPKTMCDAWRRVPGWVDTTKQVMTGLEVLTKKVNHCDTVRNILGQPQGDNFIKSSDAICQCFPRIVELGATSGFKSFEQGVVSVADSKNLDQVVKVQKLSSPNLSISDERDKIRKTLQSKAKRNVLIIEEPEINEGIYSQLMTIKSCKPGTSCTGLQIQETISKPFTPYMAEIARQFRQMLFVPSLQVLSTVDRTFLLQKKIGSIIDFYAGYSAENRDLVASTFNSLANVSSSSSADIEKEVNIKERPENDDLLQQIVMMKTVMKRDLYDYLLAMKQAFKQYDEQIAKSSFGPGKAGVVMEPSVIGHQRWTKVPKMAMPCSKQVTKTFNKAGFSKTLSFTEYYMCMVEGATAYYSKLQIPYVRLTF